MLPRLPTVPLLLAMLAGVSCSVSTPRDGRTALSASESISPGGEAVRQPAEGPQGSTDLSDLTNSNDLGGDVALADVGSEPGAGGDGAAPAPDAPRPQSDSGSATAPSVTRAGASPGVSPTSIAI